MENGRTHTGVPPLPTGAAAKGVSILVNREKRWAVTGDCQGPKDTSQRFGLVRIDPNLRGGGVQGAFDGAVSNKGQKTEPIFRGIDAMQAVAEVLEYVVKPVLGPEMRTEMCCKGKASCYAAEFTVCYAHLVSGAATTFHLANTVPTFMLQFENGKEINTNPPNHCVRVVRNHGLRTSLGRDTHGTPFSCGHSAQI
jgi:hypothetical protein